MDYFSVIIIPCRVAKKGVSEQVPEGSWAGWEVPLLGVGQWEDQRGLSEEP